MTPPGEQARHEPGLGPVPAAEEPPRPRDETSRARRETRPQEARQPTATSLQRHGSHQQDSLRPSARSNASREPCHGVRPGVQAEAERGRQQQAFSSAPAVRGDPRTRRPGTGKGRGSGPRAPAARPGPRPSRRRSRRRPRNARRCAPRRRPAPPCTSTRHADRQLEHRRASGGPPDGGRAALSAAKADLTASRGPAGHSPKASLAGHSHEASGRPASEAGPKDQPVLRRGLNLSRGPGRCRPLQAGIELQTMRGSGPEWGRARTLLTGDPTGRSTRPTPRSRALDDGDEADSREGLRRVRRQAAGSEGQSKPSGKLDEEEPPADESRTRPGGPGARRHPEQDRAVADQTRAGPHPGPGGEQSHGAPLLHSALRSPGPCRRPPGPRAALRQERHGDPAAEGVSRSPQGMAGAAAEGFGSGAGNGHQRGCLELHRRVPREEGRRAAQARTRAADAPRAGHLILRLRS